MATLIPSAYPLFKGCTRLAMVFGVPLIPLMFMVIIVASITMVVNLWWYFLALPLWFLMKQICKNDDKAFRIIGLWIDTTLRNRNKDFWNASSYTPHYHKWLKR